MRLHAVQLDIMVTTARSLTSAASRHVLFCQAGRPPTTCHAPRWSGDSITEQWRGTIYGNPCDRPGCPEGPDIFKRYFGQWRSAAFAISGTARLTAGVRQSHTRLVPAASASMGQTRELRCLGPAASVYRLGTVAA